LQGLGGLELGYVICNETLNYYQGRLATPFETYELYVNFIFSIFAKINVIVLSKKLIKLLGNMWYSCEIFRLVHIRTPSQN